MENLSKALTGKKLEDLVATKVAKESNILEPTKAEVEQIIVLLKEGTPYKVIRKTVRRVEMSGKDQVSAKGFSYGQIKEIELGMKAKVVELTPKPVVKEEVVEEEVVVE